MQTIRARFVLTFRVFIITAALGLRAWPVCAEPHQGHPSEVEALQGELAKMQTALDGVMKEQEQLRQLLSQRPSSRPRPPELVAHITVSGKPILGNPEASLTLIEFSDYQCPYCRRFFETTLPELKAEYIDTGKLRYIFRDFPLDRLHPQARKAAEAAYCAREQGQYWAMHDLLFQHQKALQLEQFQTYARSLGLDSSTFTVCMEEAKYASEVQQDIEDGTAAGVQGTPSFFLGKTSASDTIQGISLSGARPITAFRQAIERLLDSK